MTCDQARELLEELARENRSWQEVPELAEHMSDCQACSVWYAEYLQVENALRQLPTWPVPPDFSHRVLSRLSDRTGHPASQPPPGGRPFPSGWQERWQAFWEGLVHPRGRRQLVPVLVAAACVVLVVGLVYGLLAGGVPPVPGAATGSLSWPMLAVAGLVLIVLVVGLILWRRRH